MPSALTPYCVASATAEKQAPFTRGAHGKGCRAMSGRSVPVMVVANVELQRDGHANESHATSVLSPPQQPAQKEHSP